jgi:hypothetical protein
MPAAEEHMWLVRSRTEPFLSKRVEVYLAQIAMILFNTNAKKEHRKKLDDFLLFKQPVEKPVDPNIDESIKGAFGKLMKRK